MESQQKMIGMILPITKSMFNNLKNKKQAILCKFSPQERAPKYLNKGMSILFYYSQKIVGEALIERIELTKPKKVLENNKENLLAPLEEFMSYISERLNKKIILIGIKKIRVYKKEIFPIYPVPMSGRYIRENEYKIMK